MNWNSIREELSQGKTVSFRPKGNSMIPRIESGQLVTVEPADHSSIKKNDIVFCKVNGSFYVHLVYAVQGERFQIGNNKNHINGWTSANNVYGKVIKVEK